MIGEIPFLLWEQVNQAKKGGPAAPTAATFSAFAETHPLALVEVEDDEVARNGAQAPCLEANPDRLVPYCLF